MSELNDIAAIVNRLYAHKFVPYRSILFPEMQGDVCNNCGQYRNHVWHTNLHTEKTTNNEGTHNE